MKAVGYIRVSTDEQVRHGWNLDEDRDRIKQIAAEHMQDGWNLGEIYSDGGKQGDDPDRPGYNAMLTALDDIDVIVMRDLSRLARDPIIHHTAARLFVKANVQVWTFNGPVDLATPEGEFSASVLAGVNRLEKRLIGVRVKQMKAARAEAGLHPGGKRPYGYELADTGRRGRDDKVIYELRPHPVERAVVVRMFQMADPIPDGPGASQRQIAQTLNAEGIPAATGGRWAPSTVNRMLGSPLYLGKLPRRAGTVDGKHEALVSDALWQRVNASRATPQRRAGGRPMTSQHLLTRGLLRCGFCGYAMMPYALTGRAPTYRCSGRHQHGPDFCSMPAVRRDLIDAALLAELTSRYFDIDGTRDRLRARIDAEVPEAQSAVQEALSELGRAESRIAKVVRGWQDEILADDEYRHQRADLDAERDGAQAALEQAERNLAQIEGTGITTDAEEALLTHMADLRRLVTTTVEHTQDIEALRTVIRTLFERVTLQTWSWEALDEIKADGVSAGNNLYLIPSPRKGVVDWSTFPEVKINQVPVPGEVTTSRYRRR